MNMNNFRGISKCTNPRLYESGNQGIKYIGLNLMYQLRAKP